MDRPIAIPSRVVVGLVKVVVAELVGKKKKKGPLQRIQTFNAGLCFSLSNLIYFNPAAERKAAALSVFSQVKLESSRPKWPFRAVSL